MGQIDIYLDAVSTIHAIVGLFVTGYIFYLFAKPFMNNKKGAFCVGITYFVAMMILYFEPIVINTYAAYGLGILLAFTVMYRIERRNYKQKIFIAVTFFSLRWLS